MMLYTKYKSSGPCSFRQEDFWKLHFENPFSDPVTYLCNQLEQFEQLWWGTTQESFLWSLVKIQWAVSAQKLFKEIVDARTDAWTMDNGPSQKLTFSTLYYYNILTTCVRCTELIITEMIIFCYGTDNYGDDFLLRNW